MSAQLDSILSALAGTPRLPDAACVGSCASMDDVDMPDDALKICRGCSAIRACDAWAQSQPRNTLHGVIGGRVYVWDSPPSARRTSNRQTTEGNPA